MHVTDARTICIPTEYDTIILTCTYAQMAHYRNAHRLWCPRCGSDRTLRLENGTTRAAKTGYYLPCGTWFRDLFKNKELSAELSGGGDERPAGHVSHSRGWHQKVQYARLFGIHT
jgi:hypothetical protein